jgi:hypothetical protein
MARKAAEERSKEIGFSEEGTPGLAEPTSSADRMCASDGRHYSIVARRAL